MAEKMPPRIKITATIFREVGAERFEFMVDLLCINLISVE
jgi:hypothetical protein